MNLNSFTCLIRRWLSRNGLGLHTAATALQWTPAVSWLGDKHMSLQVFLSRAVGHVCMVWLGWQPHGIPPVCGLWRFHRGPESLPIESRVASRKFWSYVVAPVGSGSLRLLPTVSKSYEVAVPMCGICHLQAGLSSSLDISVTAVEGWTKLTMLDTLASTRPIGPMLRSPSCTKCH